MKRLPRPRKERTRTKDRIDRYVFGRPSDKDRDHYARAVREIDCSPAGILELKVTLVLECGHRIEGKAYWPHRRVPARLFCKECHAAACAAQNKQIPLAPSKALTTRFPKR